MKQSGAEDNRLKTWMRVAITLCGIGLIAAIILPVWKIELAAPQYPEGLVLKIFANKLGGNVDIVNGLNHYIGMKTLHADDFPEFTILPYILGFFAALCFFVAIAGKRKWLHALLGLFLLFAISAMADFWRWEYNYGHNLSPQAAIQVPGMSYQPPLIGYKKLLNFGAYSIPDIGGWLMAASGAILALCTVLSWRKKGAGVAVGAQVGAQVASSVLALMFFSSCSNGPVPIKIGADNCNNCRMAIADARFGAEVLNKNGKAWKFDDLHCLVAFLKGSELKADAVKAVYFVRFDAGHELLLSGKAMLLHSDSLHTPMGGNVAAFADKPALDEARKQFGGKEITWKELNP